MGSEETVACVPEYYDGAVVCVREGGRELVEGGGGEAGGQVVVVREGCEGKGKRTRLGTRSL